MPVLAPAQGLAARRDGLQSASRKRALRPSCRLAAARQKFASKLTSKRQTPQTARACVLAAPAAGL